MTRDQVDNENNSQSGDLNILNNIHGGSLIHGVREQSISQGYWKCEREHSNAISTGSGDTGMQRQTKTRNETY